VTQAACLGRLTPSSLHVTSYALCLGQLELWQGLACICTVAFFAPVLPSLHSFSSASCETGALSSICKPFRHITCLHCRCVQLLADCRCCQCPQVVAIAWMKQPGSSGITGVVASAKADVLVDGCSSPPPGMTASVTGLSLTKGRVLGWVVGYETDPAVADTTFDGESVGVSVTWRQRAQLEMRLNVSGEVAVMGSAAVTKSKVRQGCTATLHTAGPHKLPLYHQAQQWLHVVLIYTECPGPV